MKANVLIKPIITEKATELSENKGQYGFLVDRSANKIDIKKAVEANYKVKVKKVNTVLSGGGKQISKYTSKGVVKVIKPIEKKAYVILAEGETIDLYGNI